MLCFSVPVFSFDIGTGRLTGMGGTVLFSSPSASDYLTCPAVLLSERWMIFESGFQRKYDLTDLDKVSATVAGRYQRFSGAIGFSQFGRENYYTEKLIKGAVGAQFSMLTLAIGISGQRIEIGDNNGWFNMASLGITGGLNYKRYHLGLAADNINQPAPIDGAVRYNTIIKIYTEIEGPSTYSLTGRVALEKHEKPILAVGQYIRLQGENAIFWGVSNNPLTYGGGIDLHYREFRLCYAASYHPVLGMSHNFSVDFTWKR
jgi:hypothetical protein